MKTFLVVGLLLVFAVVGLRSTPAPADYPEPFPTPVQPPDTDELVLYISTNADADGNPTAQNCESLIPTGHQYYYKYFKKGVWVTVGWIPEQRAVFYLPKWH